MKLNQPTLLYKTRFYQHRRQENLCKCIFKIERYQESFDSCFERKLYIRDKGCVLFHTELPLPLLKPFKPYLVYKRNARIY